MKYGIRLKFKNLKKNLIKKSVHDNKYISAKVNGTKLSIKY